MGVGGNRKAARRGCDSVQSDSIAEVEKADNEEKESDDAGPSASSSSTSSITHVVTLKCIGAVRDKISQQTLRVVRDRMDKVYTAL